MKKVLLLILLIPSMCFAQKLTKNEVDEFTGQSLKKTSIEVFSSTLKNHVAYQFSQVNNTKWFRLKMIIPSSGGSVFSISKDNKIIFKLNNGEFLTLYCHEYTTTCKGCAVEGLVGSDAWGIDAPYHITDEQLEQLKNNPPVKIRVYTNDGYVEEDIKEKNQKIFIKSIDLIL